MSGQRRQYSASLKAKVAIEAIKGKKTVNEIAAEYGIRPSQISHWKKHALEGLPYLFSLRANNQLSIENALIATLYQEGLIANLYQQVGYLKVQMDRLEENHTGARQKLIEADSPPLDISHQPES